MTTRSRASSSWTRKGRTSTMRALLWESVVMMPDWEPVKLTAGMSRALRAIDSSAIVMRSPDGEEHVQLPAGRAVRHLAGERQELVGGAAHGRHHDHHLLALGAGRGDAVGHALDLLDVGDRRAAELLDDDAHESPPYLERGRAMAEGVTARPPSAVQRSSRGRARPTE